MIAGGRATAVRPPGPTWPSPRLVRRAVLVLLVASGVLGFVVLALAFLFAAPAAAQVAAPGAQSALRPAGVAATGMHRLGTLYLGVCLAVYVIVLGAMFAGLLRRRRDEDPATEAARERRIRTVVIGATIVNVLALAGLLAADIRTRSAFGKIGSRDSLEVILTGHQWWWEFQMRDPRSDSTIVTANEIHLPAGRIVRFDLRSDDVIHSFWVPNLTGKKDLIPGHNSSVALRADRPGTYTGQCAEYCGMQHATMRFLVVVEPDDRFRTWYRTQAASAAEPVTDVQRRGREVFLSAGCPLCHTVQGTDAQGRLGPDLTHLGGRSELASATLDNVPGNLAGWIGDPQHVRPGVRMPPQQLPARDLQALVAWLESLR